MGYRSLQPSPQMGTRATHRKIFVHTPFGPDGPRDVKFLRSWPEHQMGFDESDNCGVLRWGAVFGLGMTFVIGASFWTGLGLFIAYLCR
jgi:hypothetical protein